MTHSFPATHLLLAGAVLDKGQLTDAQRTGLDALVAQGIAARNTWEGVTVWEPIRAQWENRPLSP